MATSPTPRTYPKPGAKTPRTPKPSPKPLQTSNSAKK